MGANPGRNHRPDNVSASLAAEASSAHSRINIPLNLENWKGISPEIQADLLWFHQHLLDRRMPQKEAVEAIGYSHRVLATGWCRAGYHSMDGMLIKGFHKIPVREECELFDLIGLPWREPWKRNL